jgi:homocysteine S-methyltransferase
VEYGQAAKEWQAAGASLIGGCCRTTPEHIRQIRAHLS